LLANVYLHYVFDLWAHQWRRRHARGDVVIVCYADDYMVGFEYQRDAQRFLADLRDRLARFGLELAPEKTRLIEFGRYAARNRARRGQGKPQTFDFLGFKHCCSKTKNGRFMLKRITIAKRMQAKLREVKDELKWRRHHPIPDQGRWLKSVVRGHYAYYAVPGNSDAINAFYNQVARHWYRALGRRSQRTRMNWMRMRRIHARCFHPQNACTPSQTRASTPKPKAGAQCARRARWDLCGGPPAGLHGRTFRMAQGRSPPRSTPRRHPVAAGDLAPLGHIGA
jgi:RNA-directed DNA polymerase